MQSVKCRKINIIDVIILVAATGLSFAWCRMFSSLYFVFGQGFVFEFFPRGRGSPGMILWSIWGWIHWTLPFATMWTLALLVLRLHNLDPAFVA